MHPIDGAPPDSHVAVEDPREVVAAGAGAQLAEVDVPLLDPGDPGGVERPRDPQDTGAAVVAPHQGDAEGLRGQPARPPRAIERGVERLQLVVDPSHEVAFPESVVQFFRGELGQPYGGFPRALQHKVLNGGQPLTDRPGAVLPSADLEAERQEAVRRVGRSLSDTEFASYLMYPKVFAEYAKHRGHFGNVSVLPTRNFFYGMEVGEELSIELERGKTLIIRLVAVSAPHDDGTRTVFFELNGQPRSVRITEHGKVPARPRTRKADIADSKQVGAPMPGKVVTVAVASGQKVSRGETLVTLEAMKMEALVRADQDGEIAEVLVRPGAMVDAKDLLVVFR